jgi:chromosomal replication initiation ATPase DnaA
MAKIDLDSLSIEELAALRDAVTDKLAQKVTARQAELEAELERLAQYGRLTKKALVAPPVAKAKKAEPAARKADEAKDAVAKDAVAEAA